LSPGTPVADLTETFGSKQLSHHVNTNLQDTYWERVVSDFRKLCVLRRQRRQKESEALLRSELPRSIAEWSRQQPGEPLAKRAQLDAMFQTEQRRVEDAMMMQDLLSSKLVEDFVPVICSRISEEVRRAMAVAELFSHDQREERRNETLEAQAEAENAKVSFDDIPSILDLLMTEQPAGKHRRLQSAV
jgi:hypothetical protein